MAKIIIMVDTDGNQVEKLANVVISDEDWEESCYRLGCAVAKLVAEQYLEDKAEQLDKDRPSGYRVKNTNPRTLVTRFGDVTFSRRLYQDKEGEYHFLLDEHLNLRSRQAATASLTEALLDSATKLSFRKVSAEVHKYTAGVLSASTIHRLLQEVTRNAIHQERSEWSSCFEGGTSPPPSARKVDLLYTEADGVFVHLQQEEQEHYELKNGITYEGWERISDGHYRVLNKRVYSHGNDRIPFWEGMGIHWSKHWDLGRVKMIVLGGDDASWIDKGVEELGICVRQLSGFHLSRACRKGWEHGGELYDAIRWGIVKPNQPYMKERSGKTASKARSYVLHRVAKGLDWRKKIQGTYMESLIPASARGLGAIEGNESNLFADRMKDRGMSWTIAGAQHMGKAIELSFNGELRRWCGRKPSESVAIKNRPSFELFDELGGYGERTALPALEGPHASRPWAKMLKSMTSFYNPLN